MLMWLLEDLYVLNIVFISLQETKDYIFYSGKKPTNTIGTLLLLDMEGKTIEVFPMT